MPYDLSGMDDILQGTAPQSVQPSATPLASPASSSATPSPAPPATPSNYDLSGMADLLNDGMPATATQSSTPAQSGGTLATLGSAANSTLGKVGMDLGSMGTFGAAGAEIGALGGPLAPIMVPLGAAIGMGIGGGLSKAAQTELGRESGDYNGSPQDQMKDIGKAAFLSMLGGKLAQDGAETVKGLDSLLNFSSQAGPGPIVRAAQHIGKWASDNGKDMLAQFYSTMTGKTPGAFKTLFDNAGKVMGSVKSYLSGSGGDQQAAQIAAAQDAIKNTETLADESSKALPRLWRQNMDNLINSDQAKGMNFTFGDMVTDIHNGLQDAGLGGLQIKNGAVQFVPYNPTSAASARLAGQKAQVISQEAQDVGQQLADKLTSYLQMGKVRGKVAANALTDLQTEINGLTRQYASSTDPALKAIISQTSAAFKNSIADQFDAVGLKDQFLQGAQLYDQHGDNIAMARQLLNTSGGPERLAAKLSADSTRLGGKTQTTNDMVDSFRALLGPRADQLLGNIRQADAARQFIPWLPDRTRQAVAVGAGAARLLGAKGMIGVSPMLMGAMATQASPRLVASQFLLGQNTAKLLQSDAGLAEFIKTIASMPSQQQAVKGALLQHVTQNALGGNNGQPQ